jgi:hypothetical protein
LLFLFQELKGRSQAKAELLHQKEGLRVQLNQQRESLAQANGLLAERSAEMADLYVYCFDLKAELAVAWGEVTSLVNALCLVLVISDNAQVLIMCLRLYVAKDD